MTNSKLYYGLPQSRWDELLIKAEDLLRDNELGTHLVGIYPAGNRIYGVESSPPSILCLYVDSVEALINPASATNTNKLAHDFQVDEAGSSVILLDLFQWTKWILNRPLGLGLGLFLHAIPVSSQILYEDSSIAEILDCAKEFMMQINQGADLSTMIRLSLQDPYYLFWARTQLILSMTNQFHPCINQSWDAVYNLEDLTDIPDHIVLLDKNLISYMLTGEEKFFLSETDEETLERWYNQMFEKIPVAQIPEKKLLGDAVAKLYRSLI